MAERVLVTGGTGFLGQALVRALRDQGRAVRVLVRPRQNRVTPARWERLRVQGVEMVIGDVLDKPAAWAAVQDVTHVFHLAGRLYVPGAPNREYEQLHVEGTRNVLTACAESKAIRAIVHCSTTGVLGPTGETPAAEDAPMRPGNIYERTKAAGEQLALALAHRDGLPLSVARPALVYGPGDRHLLGWFRAIKRGYYRVVGSGDSLLHPIYIDDVVDGLLRCAQTPEAVGRVYHLAGDRALPTR
ncbi:MAG: NAD-dependent epimerase/dehydratase family protein, partial [Anaerolineales bacterium]